MYNIIGYNIYICPEIPTENGKYYGKTPILNQAETVVRKAHERGLNLFIKAVCSDGKERYMN